MKFKYKAYFIMLAMFSFNLAFDMTGSKLLYVIGVLLLIGLVSIENPYR